MSQFNTNYSTEHWIAAKRILRFLKGTADYGLMYRKSGMPLYGVVDADWGANTVDRRSYSGYAFILAGAAVCWEARKQRTVALSSVEAEYMAMSEATKEAIYLQGAIELQYMSTNDMPADILTKGLTGVKHLHCQDGLGMIEY
ncbi:retrovirus-related pol polyprotein from transposon tnt 1-94, partial [Lasius niger]